MTGEGDRPGVRPVPEGFGVRVARVAPSSTVCDRYPSASCRDDPKWRTELRQHRILAIHQASYMIVNTQGHQATNMFIAMRRCKHCDSSKTNQIHMKTQAILRCLILVPQDGETQTRLLDNIPDTKTLHSHFTTE